MTRFCLLSTQRSGSTWLLDLIAKIPGITIFPELFNKPLNPGSRRETTPAHYAYCVEVGDCCRPWRVLRYLDLVASASRDGGPVGFKLMYNQLVMYPEILLKFVRDRYVIIHLMRENTLDVIISMTVARETNQWSTRQTIEVESIYLNPKTLVRRIRRHQRRLRNFKVLCRLLPNRVVAITYDALRANVAGEMGRLTSLLTHRRHHWDGCSEFRKIVTKPQRDVVANYDEICRILEPTPYACFLVVD